MVQTRGSLRNGRRSPASIQLQGDTGSDDDFSTPDAGDVSSDSAYDSGTEVDLSQMPLKKRQKRSRVKNPREKAARTSKTATVKRRKGKLELLPTMNLDVLHQILSFLLPIDLLNLSRTTKAFRSLLMQKSSAFIWREARYHIKNFPDCPADLSEPQYANLAFYPHCHGCGKRVKSVIWELRVRYCPMCLKELTITWSEIHSITEPCMDVNNCKWFAIPAADINMGSRRTLLVCLTSQFDALRRDISGKKKEERQLIIQQGKALTQAIEAHAKKCRQWEEQAAVTREEELEDIRYTRRVEICVWLNHSEFLRDIQHFGARIYEHPIFNEPKPLTPKSWVRVRSILTYYILELRKKNTVSFVYPTRRDILTKACQQYIKDRSSQSGSIEPIPGWRFLASLKVFDDIIKAPSQTPLTDDMFSSAFAKLPEILSPFNLRMKVERKLSALCLMPASSKADHDFVLRRLKLASSFFICGGILLAYPEVLQSAFSNLEASTVLEDTSLEVDKWDIGSGSRISRYQVAAGIISLCGLDPTIATPDDMEAKNVLLSCSRCHPAANHAMTWRSAVIHAQAYSHKDCLHVAQGLLCQDIGQ